MTGGDQREPLWASSLAHQRRHEDVVVRVMREPPEEAPPRRAVRRSVGPRALAVGVVAAIVVVAVVALAITPAGRDWLTVRDVPSAWGDVPMTCHTARFEEDNRAFEWFRCRAVGGGTLPPGTYRSPDDQWTSDITRRDARANEMQISPDGTLTGWAAY